MTCDYVWLLLTQRGQDLQEFKQKLHRCYKIYQSTSTQTGSGSPLLQAERYIMMEDRSDN